MSAVRGFGLNGKSYYTNVAKPQSVFLSYAVLATNGLGVTSVKSNGYVNYVFMHTSTTPTATNGITNPNPAAGYALIGLTNNFNAFLGLRAQVSQPPTNTTQTSVTAGSVYIITALGTATLAEWLAKGYPYGFTPAVGQSFVATDTGTIGGSANVGSPGSSYVTDMSVVGDPALLISNSSVSKYGGAQVMVQFEDILASGTISAPTFTGAAATPTGTVSQPTLTMDSYTPAGTNDGGSPPLFTGTPATLTGTVSQPTFTGASATPTGTVSAPTFTSSAAASVIAPTDGSVIRMELCFDGSSVSIDGLQ